MAVTLDRIVPWGRTREEYERMFALRPADLRTRILDCGGGPASFTAEMTAAGFNATAVDPIYAFSAAEIRARFDAVVRPMLEQIRATPNDWSWTFHRGPDGLCNTRRIALNRFLADYETGLREKRYLVAELPMLPFPAQTFGLALVSHLLFLYSELLNEEFHRAAILELLRVAKEVRIFPLLTLAAKPYPHLQSIRTALKQAGFESEIVTVDYELQRGGNRMLRVFEMSAKC